MKDACSGLFIQCEMKDFFISYDKADSAWAEWIAWILEEAGYQVFLEEWDYRPGENFVLRMHQAAQDSERTIALLSNDYLRAAYKQREWAAAFAKDDKGQERSLIPMKVTECSPTGLLENIKCVDLVDLSEQDARSAVLGAFSSRAKPAEAPIFPSENKEKLTTSEEEKRAKHYPGAATNRSRDNITDAIIKMAEHEPSGLPARRLSRETFKLSVSERIEVAETLSAIPPQQFNIIVFALDTPAGIIPSMPAPQMDRAMALLVWAESPAGCGVSEVQQLLRRVSRPSGLPSGHDAHLVQPIPPARVTKVSALLGRIDLPELVVRQSYYASSQSPLILPDELKGQAARLLSFCLDRLSKSACRVPDSAPLLEFVQRLSLHPSAVSIKTELTEWMTEVAQELEVDIELISRKVVGDAEASGVSDLSEPYLLVKVEQSHWNAEQFEVKGWLLYADDYHGLNIREEPCAFDDLPDLLISLIEASQEKLLSLVGDREDALAELVVEIFLPTRLLACGVDRWDVPIGVGMTRPVGELYRIAVRSYERTYHSAYRLLPKALWRKKWLARPRKPHQMTESHVCWACNEDDLCENLFDKLKDSGIIFAALTPILPDVTGGDLKTLHALLNSGTAIALWPRQTLVNVSVARDDISDLFFGHGLDGMLRAVLKRRADARLSGSDDVVWNCLTLMWDDPDRPPPDVVYPKLKAPN